MKLILLICGFYLLTSFSLAQENLSSYEGEYQIQPGFNITITYEGEELFVKATKKPKEKLIKIEDDLYKIESIDGKIDFSLVEEKDFVIVYMYGTIIHSPRLPYEENIESPQEIKLTSEELEKFVGSYQVTTRQDLIITLDDSSLSAQMSGEPVFPIYPYDSNKFFYKIAPVHLEFIMNDDGSVKYLLLKQANGIIQANKN